ncbi:MAG: RNA polymerase factor sigma-54 [Dysgonamonadaceae bacterium]|jgi:RNA polymerase sigma-54 factor|nr:RNA polymerase factor sigma-54 [Dysgonamonadaceae bacterium]
MIKQRLSQKQQQKLSPLQIQQIKMLELTGIEIENRINRELEENPALEEAYENLDAEEGLDAAEPDAGDASEEDIALGDYLTEDDIPDYKLQQPYYSNKTTTRDEIPYSESESLQEYLLDQFRLKNLSEEQFQIGEYLLGSIDADGYIRQNIEAISDDLAFQYGWNVSVPQIATVLKAIQQLEPPGIGAVNLQDCLLIQLKRKEKTPARNLAVRVLETRFEAFTKKQYDKIEKSLNITEAELKDAMKEITLLNPRPGNAWESNLESKMAHITPDFLVEAVNGELILSMQENIPELRVSKEYGDMLNQYAKPQMKQTQEQKEAGNFIKQKIEAAGWFINAVKQRNVTLRNTMTAIMKIQRDFFLSGEESKLKPMILKDVSELCGYDISTVSRVSNSKYVQTNFGIYPLKYFFSESMTNDEGEEVSTREIKLILKTCIEEEDKTNPLTDETLMKELKNRGYDVARRTVAKYREQLNIPVARLRKEI